MILCILRRGSSLEIDLVAVSQDTRLGGVTVRTLYGVELKRQILMILARFEAVKMWTHDSVGFVEELLQFFDICT